jgi:hypothetical protein
MRGRNTLYMRNQRRADEAPLCPVLNAEVFEVEIE